MNDKCIPWKDGSLLHPNSRAYQLHQDKKFKELDEHMRDVNALAKQLKEKQ